MIKKMRGFTLLELIVAIVLMGIISVVISRVLLNGYQHFLTAQNISETDWKGFLVLSRLVDDIHTIRTPEDISTIAATQLTFTNTSNSTVQYQLSSGTVFRNGLALATGVQGFALSYLDKNGSATGTVSAVRFIVISVTLTQDNLTQSFSTVAAVRV